MEHSAPGKNPTPAQDTVLASMLRQEAPRHLRLWWLLPAILGLVAFRLYLSYAQPEPVKKTHTPPSYKVAMDPETERRLKIIEELRKRDEPPPEPKIQLTPLQKGYFRVAAAQIQSTMGNSDKNRRKMEAYLRKAAESGVRLLVFPEAALPGYADPEHFVFWAKDPKAAVPADEAEDFLPVLQAAESATGPEVQFFQKLAAELKIYIALPYIEKSGEHYFSSLLLIDEGGKTLLNRRKNRLWAVGDRFWVTKSEDAQQSVQTALGRIGLVLSYDMTTDFPALHTQGVTLILHSAAFYGENMQRWADTRYRALVEKAGCSVVLANWGCAYVPAWDGYGISRVYAPGGKLLAGQGEQEGEFLVIADLPLPGTPPPAAPAPVAVPGAKP